MFCVYVTDPDLLENPDHQKNYARMGALVSISSVDPVDVGAGLAVVEKTYVTGWLWDESLLEFVDPGVPENIGVQEFFDLLTTNEILAYFSAGPEIEPVRRAFDSYIAMRKSISRSSGEVSMLLDILVDAGVLTADRKAELVA